MKIETSQISLAAAHRFAARTETQESLRAWSGPRPDDGGDNPRSSTTVQLSDAARQAAAQANEAAPANAVRENKELIDDPHMRLLKMVIEILTGTRVKTIRKEDLHALEEAQDVPEAMRAAQQLRDPQENFGAEYRRTEVFEESESSSLTASGIIRTADGKEIRFNLSLTMERSYRETREETLLFGNAQRVGKDPLVINFDGDAAQLQSMRVSFDLDGDGTKEDVPLLAGNRGYLALDLNHNGRIDSGRELFGPVSGDGFADLAQYDADGNGWIDENDPVFDELRIWMQGTGDGGTLATLKEKGIGAIYLGRAATPFALNDSSNNGLGVVRTSGIYLTEDGRAGTVQQIDLKV